MSAPTPTALKGPPAVWLAFARQGRWKSWVLVGQLLLIALLVVALWAVASRPPDVVVVGEDGHGTYIPTGATTSALQDFLRQQRGRAADVTVLNFSERFVRLTAGVNSTTVDESWQEALGMMQAGLAQRMAAEATSQKMLETYHLAQLRTGLRFEAVELVERRGDKAHVEVRVRRRKEKLVGGGVSEDALRVELILVDVPRTRAHPDGLEVLDWRTGPLEASAPSATTPPSSPPAHAP